MVGSIKESGSILKRVERQGQGQQGQQGHEGQVVRWNTQESAGGKENTERPRRLHLPRAVKALNLT